MRRLALGLLLNQLKGCCNAGTPCRALAAPARLGAAAGAAARALLAVASGPAPALATVAVLIRAVRRNFCGRAAGGCGERCGAGGERGACAARRRGRGHAAGLRLRALHAGQLRRPLHASSCLTSYKLRSVCAISSLRWGAG